MNNLSSFVNKLMSNNQVLSNPIIQNAMNMAKNNNIQGLQELANNIAKEKGTTIEDIRKHLGI